MVQSINQSITYNQIKVRNQPENDNEIVNLQYFNNNTGSTLDFQKSVIDKDITDTSALTPSDGDRYIVATSAIGVWSGKDNNIAQWDENNNGWEFINPENGMITFVEDEDILYIFDGTSWNNFSSTISIDHNDTNLIQGGLNNEYFHLTETQHTNLTSLTSSEIQQLQNIDTNTISNTQWSYLSVLDQSLRTTDNVIFDGLTINGFNVGNFVGLTNDEINQIKNINTNTISNTQWGYLANSNQNLRTTDSPNFVRLNCRDITLDDNNSDGTIQIISRSSGIIKSNYIISTSNVSSDLFFIDDKINDRRQISCGNNTFDIISSDAQPNGIRFQVNNSKSGSSNGSTTLQLFNNGNILSLTGYFQQDHLRLDGNTLSSQNTNGNLNLSANGTGNVYLFSNLNVNNNEITNCNLLDVDNIRLDGNTLSIANTNGNINLSPNGSGIVNCSAQIECTSKLYVNSSSDSHIQLDSVNGATSRFKLSTSSVVNDFFYIDDTENNERILEYNRSGNFTFKNFNTGEIDFQTSGQRLRLGNNMFKVDYLPTTSGGSVSVLYNTITGEIEQDTSSKKYKDHIKYLDDNIIDLLKPVEYKYKKSGIKAFGVYAEDICEDLPKEYIDDFIVYDKNKLPKSVKYHNFTAHLIHKCQKQQKEINSLTEIIFDLQNRIEKLENKKTIEYEGQVNYGL